MGSKTQTIGACMTLLRTENMLPLTFRMPWRTMLCAMKSTTNAGLAQREMPKIRTFRRRRPVWDYSKPEEGALEKRLDDLYYNQSDMHKREYARTWSNYPENVKIVKKKPPVLPNDEILPIRRRPTSERPSTAQPWDDEVLEFIRKVDSDNEDKRSKRGPNADTNSFSKYKYQAKHVPTDVYEPDKLYKFYH